MLSLFSKMTLTLKIEISIIIRLLCFARYKSWLREKSENITCICLDPYILNSFSYLDPISINVSQLCLVQVMVTCKLTTHV